MDTKKNKCTFKARGELHQEMEAILSFMARANRTGDDVTLEIDSSIHLLSSILSELKALNH